MRVVVPVVERALRHPCGPLHHASVPACCQYPLGACIHKNAGVVPQIPRMHAVDNNTPVALAALAGRTQMSHYCLHACRGQQHFGGSSGSCGTLACPPALTAVAVAVA